MSPQDIQDIQEHQETQETRKPKAMQISIFHQIMCCTWRKSSRSWDKDMFAVRRMKWKASMWTQLFGKYLCLSLFKLQFIKGKITRTVCDLPRTNLWNHVNGYFKWLRGWSRIRQKSVVWPRLITKEPESDWDYECQNLCLRRLGALSGKCQWPTSRSLEE